MALFQNRPVQFLNISHGALMTGPTDACTPWLRCTEMHLCIRQPTKSLVRTKL